MLGSTSITFDVFQEPKHLHACLFCTIIAALVPAIIASLSSISKTDHHWHPFIVAGITPASNFCSAATLQQSLPARIPTFPHMRLFWSLCKTRIFIAFPIFHQNNGKSSWHLCPRLPLLPWHHRWNVLWYAGVHLMVHPPWVMIMGWVVELPTPSPQCRTGRLSILPVALPLANLVYLPMTPKATSFVCSTTFGLLFCKL